MKLLKWLKGKRKQIEMRKLEPDKEFNFQQEYYQTESITTPFKFIFTNNFNESYYPNEELKDLYSFIECEIIVSNGNKELYDILTVMDEGYNLRQLIPNILIYMHIKKKEDKLHLYMRGNILFYKKLCSIIHNNIIIKYINTNIFPNGETMRVLDRFIGSNTNSIIYPSKDIDILFIQEESNFNPIIGLSITTKIDLTSVPKSLKYLINNTTEEFIYNDRFIIYTELSNLDNQIIEYLKKNKINIEDYSNKLLINTPLDDIDNDVDEYI